MKRNFQAQVKIGRAKGVLIKICGRPPLRRAGTEVTVIEIEREMVGGVEAAIGTAEEIENVEEKGNDATGSIEMAIESDGGGSLERDREIDAVEEIAIGRRRMDHIATRAVEQARRKVRR